MNLDRKALPGLKVTIMGLGLHGGGLASARFFAAAGADVTVTDLRTERELGPSLEKLAGLGVRLVLGRHETSDFSDSDLVIKNPAVRRDSPFLAAARRIETDVSVFLRLAAGHPVLAVTGSKGKSTTVSALHHILRAVHPGARLGGNITVSPLTFLDELGPADTVVLELSSWQLADLRGLGCLRPRVAAVTNLLHDHMNYYSRYEDYAADKAVLFESQGPEDDLVLDESDSWTPYFRGRAASRITHIAPDSGFGGFPFVDAEAGVFRDGRDVVPLLPDALPIPGVHTRKNLLFAGAMALLFGVPAETIRERIGGFRGIPHRLEPLGERDGVLFVNDSAATMPDAAAAALRSFERPVVIIAGGTDKNLDFAPFVEALRLPAAVVLLEGNATAKLAPLLDAAGVSYRGPYGDLPSAFREALSLATPGSVVLLSPGCASFGLFLNEFDRGDRFKALVREQIGEI